MTAHALNLAIHIAAGTLAIGLGVAQLATEKSGEPHRRRGRYFFALALLVTGTGAIGNIFFRFLPLFSVLTVLVLYQAVSGFRVARTRERGPARLDLAWSVAGLAAGLALIPSVLLATAERSTQPVVVWSSLGALAMVLTYDFARWAFPREWHRRAWELEHIYKMLAAFFGMVSALVGNTVRRGQPWSQVLPSAIGLACIAWFIVRRTASSRTS